MNPPAAGHSGQDVLVSVLRERAALRTLTEAQWSALFPAAEGARLLPRLALDAERLGLTTALPEWVRDRLLSAQVRGREYERVVKWEINRIHRALLPIGLRPVLLKGAAYVAASLPSGVGRVVADVDILMSEKDIPRAEAALREHGWEFAPLSAYDDRYYRQWMHELPPMRHRERGTMLDVHHRLLPKTGRVHPPTGRLLEKAVEVNGAAVLSPEHMLLHSAAHLFQDGAVAGALRDVLDLRDLLESFGENPEFGGRLAEEATALDLGRPLFYAVRYAAWLGRDPESRVVPDVSRPSRALLVLMDQLVTRTLMRPAGVLSSAGAFALYVRSHWLRMPMRQLLPHLITKALKK